MLLMKESVLILDEITTQHQLSYFQMLCKLTKIIYDSPVKY